MLLRPPGCFSNFLLKYTVPPKSALKYHPLAERPSRSVGDPRPCASNKVGVGREEAGAGHVTALCLTSPEDTPGALNLQSPQVSSAGRSDPRSDVTAQVCHSPMRQPLEAAPESPCGEPCPHPAARSGPPSRQRPEFQVSQPRSVAGL